MTNHLDAVSLKEHQRVLDMARGFADRAETAEAEVERLTAALAERDRRIAHALARLQWAACTVRGCTNPGCAAVHEARAILRGES